MTKVPPIQFALADKESHILEGERYKDRTAAKEALSKLTKAEQKKLIIVETR